MMYLAAVFLLMFALPIGSIALEIALQSDSIGFVALVGRWFVFWAVGMRLLLAGLRQFLQPQFTAYEIFGLSGSEALPIVRELGISNAAAGLVGLCSIIRPDFVVPAALYASLFCGVAGVRHAFASHRSPNETIAMVSDLFVAAVLTAVVVVRFLS